MPQSLAELEAARTRILQQFLTIGDFRPGTVSATPRRCGKAACHCAQADGVGHPQFRLLHKVKGKTVAESFATPAAFRQATEQVTAFHRFQDLIAELTAVNEQICGLRPVESDMTGWTEMGEKTAAAVHQEVAREVQTLLQLVFAARRKEGSLDLEAIEMATRASLHPAGAVVPAGLLGKRTSPMSKVVCSCGCEARYHDHRRRRLLTAVGVVEFDAPGMFARSAVPGRARDHELHIKGTHHSPGVRRMLAVVGSESSFDDGREQLALLAGLEVTTKAVAAPLYAPDGMRSPNMKELRCSQPLLEDYFALTTTVLSASTLIFSS